MFNVFYFIFNNDVNVLDDVEFGGPCPLTSAFFLSKGCFKERAGTWYDTKSKKYFWETEEK